MLSTRAAAEAVYWLADCQTKAIWWLGVLVVASIQSSIGRVVLRRLAGSIRCASYWSSRWSPRDLWAFSATGSFWTVSGYQLRFGGANWAETRFWCCGDWLRECRVSNFWSHLKNCHRANIISQLTKNEHLLSNLKNWQHSSSLSKSTCRHKFFR